MKNFTKLPLDEVIDEDASEQECHASTALIDTVEKYFEEKRHEDKAKGLGKPDEVPPLDEEWIGEGASAKSRGLIRDFKPLPVEKKVSIHSTLVNRLKRPTFVVQIENTTDHSLEDVMIHIELDKPLFQIKKEGTEVPLIKPNIAKKAIVRFIPTDQEGSCVGRGQITFFSNGEKNEHYLKNFQLANRWPVLKPYILPEDDWETFIENKERIDADIFTYLSPHYLSSIIQNTVRERGFNEIKVEKNKEKFHLYYCSSSGRWHYGLQVDIKPSMVEKGMSIISMRFYSVDNKLMRLKDMLVALLENKLKKEEEAVRSKLFEDYSAWEVKKAHRYAEKKDKIEIKTPEWSDRDGVTVPVWQPETLPTKTYTEEGLPSDFNIYNKYSKYYEEYFIPYPEKKGAVSIKPRKGLVYLFEDPGPVRAFRVFRAMISHGLLGKFVTREYPAKVLKKYKLEEVPYMWLSKSREVNALAPTDTEKIRFQLIKFLKEEDKKGNTVVLMDGMEYLITHNSFVTILKLVQALKDQVSLTNGTLLIPISPNTLEEREIKLIEREADVVIR